MYQEIKLIGDLGRDPEMRYTPQGQAVTNFSIAVTNAYTRKDGEQVKDTLWFRVSVWGSMAEACQKYLSKGSRVFVEGRMKPPRVYEKNDKTWDAQLEVNASNVKFLDKLGSGSHKQEEPNPYEAEYDIPGFTP